MQVAGQQKLKQGSLSRDDLRHAASETHGEIGA